MSAAPRTPEARAVARAACTAVSTSTAPRAKAAGGGCTTRIAPRRPISAAPRAMAATSAAESARAGTRSPVVAVKNPGNSSVPYPTTVTPSDSKRSSVAGRSRIDLAPAHTTTTGDRASSARSADSSNAGSRCTPPIPPVANTGIPAAVQSASAPATVVAPSRPCAITTGRSRAETFWMPSRARKRSRSSPSRPRVGTPRTTAVTAGTAPRAVTAARIRRSASRLDGIGSPCARTELSSATIGRRSRRAAATSGLSRMARGALTGPPGQQSSKSSARRVSTKSRSRASGSNTARILMLSPA